MDQKIKLLAGLILLTGCDSDEPRGEARQCPQVKSCPDSDARRPELDPKCNELLSQYLDKNWKVPENSSFTPSVGKVDDWVYEFSFNFGPDRPAESRLTAWLEEGQDLRIQFALSVGSELRDPGPWSVVLLLDGEARPTSLSEGEPAKANQFELDDEGLASGTLSIPSSEIPKGASSGNLLISSSKGSPLEYDTFTVLNGSAQFQKRSEPVKIRAQAVSPSARAQVRRVGALSLLPSTPPDSDGRLPLQFSISPRQGGSCSSLTHRGLVVGFLDREAIELGELGKRPAFEIKEGMGVETKVELTDLPMDGKQHVLEFWWLDGDGEYSEAPEGEFAAWYDFPVPLGHVAWGGDSKD